MKKLKILLKKIKGGPRLFNCINFIVEHTYQILKDEILHNIYANDYMY